MLSQEAHRKQRYINNFKCRVQKLASNGHSLSIPLRYIQLRWKITYSLNEYLPTNCPSLFAKIYLEFKQKLAKNSYEKLK